MIIDEWWIFGFVEKWPVHHNGNGQSEDEDANEGAQAADQLNMCISVIQFFYLSVFLYFCIAMLSAIFVYFHICVNRWKIIWST